MNWFSGDKKIMARDLSSARLSAVCAALAALFVGQAQAQPEQRPVYPASSPDASYKELDKLPDWRGIWQPNLGRVSGGEPQLIGEAKAFYERERAKECQCALPVRIRCFCRRCRCEQFAIERDAFFDHYGAQAQCKFVRSHGFSASSMAGKRWRRALARRGYQSFGFRLSS